MLLHVFSENMPLKQKWGHKETRAPTLEKWKGDFKKQGVCITYHACDQSVYFLFENYTISMSMRWHNYLWWKLNLVRCTLFPSLPKTLPSPQITWTLRDRSISHIAGWREFRFIFNLLRFAGFFTIIMNSDCVSSSSSGQLITSLHCSKNASVQSLEWICLYADWFVIGVKHQGSGGTFVELHH